MYIQWDGGFALLPMLCFLVQGEFVDDLEPPTPPVPIDVHFNAVVSSFTDIPTTTLAGNEPGISMPISKMSVGFPEPYKPISADIPPSVAPEMPYPSFELREVPPRDCADLKTKNCHMEIEPVSCVKGQGFRAACSAQATASELSEFLTKLAKTNAGKGLKLTLIGPRNFSKEMLSPAKDFLIGLVIEDFNNFNMRELVNIAPSAPWLTELRMINCQNITLRRTNLKVLPKLTVLVFTCSTFEMIEKSAFDLENLRVLALDHEFNCNHPDSRLGHLQQFHCSCEQEWLRSYLRRRTFLTKSRRIGEVYHIGGIANRAYSQTDLYTPVDCAREDLVGKPGQTEFSVNINCTSHY